MHSTSGWQFVVFHCILQVHLLFLVRLPPAIHRAVSALPQSISSPLAWIVSHDMPCSLQHQACKCVYEPQCKAGAFVLCARTQVVVAVRCIFVPSIKNPNKCRRGWRMRRSSSWR